MQNKKAGKDKLIPARKAGTDTIRRDQRAVENGNRKARADDHALPESILHLLVKDLVPLPLFRFSSINENENELFKSIDTEEKQLQAISDLWDIIKAQPKYRKLKEPNLNAEDNPLKVLHYMLRKVGALAKGKQWEIDTYKEGSKTRYRFVILKHYPSGGMTSGAVRDRDIDFPVDFLPFLKEKDRQLHDIIIETLALLSRYCRVPLWDEDGDYSEGLETLSNVSDGSSSIAQSAVEIYQEGGIADHYLKLIKARRNVATGSTLSKIMFGYECKTSRQRKIIDWSWWARDLASTKRCISDFIYIPNHDPTGKKSLNAFQKYKIVWSIHKYDFLHAFAEAKANKTIRAYGKYRPVSFTITLPGEKMKPFVFSDFPISLDKFMGYGLSIFTKQHEGFFYKHTLKGKLTPMECLLQQIELKELKNG